MKSLLLTCALTLLAAPAVAGCVNYTDGSTDDPAPRVATCFDGRCEETTMIYVCGNAHDVRTGYANGWKTYASTGKDGDSELWRPDGSAVPVSDHDKFECKPVGADFIEGCG